MLHVEAPILLAYSFRILVEAHALTRPYSVVVGMLDVQTLLLFDWTCVDKTEGNHTGSKDENLMDHHWREEWGLY